jgi:HlyD family secretion protein
LSKGSEILLKLEEVWDAAVKKIIGLILLLLAAVSVFWVSQGWYQKQEARQKESMLLYGNVEIRRVHLGFRVAGRIDAIFCEEGDRIPKGTVIAKLDQKPYLDNLAVAEAQVKQAEANCERFENGTRPQEIEQAKAVLEECRANLKFMEAELERAEKLIKRNAVTKYEYETSLSQRDVAAARKKHAEETLRLLEEGFRKEEVAAAKAQLAEAKGNRDKMQTALNDTELISPNDGVLLTRVEEPGAVVQTGQTIVTLSLKDAVWIYVYVPEPDIGKVPEGMKAEIMTDSNRNKIYTGQVGFISPEAEFTPKNVETPKLRTDLVYRVRIIADAPDDGLRQGMPVTVRLYYSR